MIPFDDRFVLFGRIFIDVLKCMKPRRCGSSREVDRIKPSSGRQKEEDEEEHSVNGQSVFTHEKKKKKDGMKCSERRQ
jgi:hypothetical protein